jgi:hypothetical protein
MQSGPAVWFIVLTVGAVALLLVMAYGIMRNRTRTPAEKKLTDEATKREYQAEDRDRS